MIKLSVFPAGLLVASAVTALLQGCVVSRINPDVTERANAAGHGWTNPLHHSDAICFPVG
jgi:hypothetical protein